MAKARRSKASKGMRAARTGRATGRVRNFWRGRNKK